MTGEEEALLELRAMSPDKLAEIDHDVIIWTCCVAGCQRLSRVKDYGVSPYYFWKKRFQYLRDNRFFCGKHWQYFRRVPSKLVYKDDPHLLP